MQVLSFQGSETSFRPMVIRCFISLLTRKVITMEKMITIEKRVKKKVTEKRFKVKGMHCHSCEILIKDCLEETPGVRSALVNQKTGTADVSFDQSKVSEDKLKQVIKECGFEVG